MHRVALHVRRVVLFAGIVFREWNGVRVWPRAAWEIATAVHDVPWDYREGRAR